MDSTKFMYTPKNGVLVHECLMCWVKDPGWGRSKNKGPRMG
jgi:hypothetical protein